MTNHTPAALAGTLTLALLLAGCSGGNAPEPTVTESTAASTSPAPDTESNDAKRPASDVSGAVDEVRDGTWQVGDAGEVEFTAQNGNLSLTEVRPAAGWQQRVTDEKASELEVHFTRDNQEWKFEVEVENGTTQISKELTIRNGQGGDFQVGSAATVTLDTAGGKLSVSNIAPADGWSTQKQDESPNDVELGFRNTDGDGTAEFEAETGSDGVKIEISQKLRGPIG